MSMTRTRVATIAILVTVLLIPPCVAGETPVQRPFETLLPWTHPRGEWTIGTGLTGRHDVSPIFHVDQPSARRDEWRFSIIDATVGLGGGGQARLQFGLQHFSEDGGLDKTGIEDARLTLSWQLPMNRCGAAAHVMVKLPNAGNDERLGTDETDIFFIGSAGQSLPRWGWAAQLGFGILGSPTDAGVQDDLMVLGAAAWMPLGGTATKLTLFGELGGYAASRFGNDFRIARAGLRLLRRFPVDLSVRRGLTSESERWGFEAGLTIRPRATAAAHEP